MGMTVKVTGQPFAQLELTNKQLMKEVGLLARERIIRRTLSGEAVDGSAFVPYSQDYRATKAAELGSASPVNLQVSGRMLQGIVVADVTDDSVTLTFKD